MNPQVFLLLVFTVVVEVGVALLVPEQLSGLSRRRFAGAVALVNLASHPLACVAVGRGVPFALVEMGVVLTEAGLLVVLTRRNLPRTLFLSLLLNGPTVLLSLLLPL